MKKWHLEGIINCSTPYSRKIVIPDENRMYHQVVQTYLHRAHKESAVLTFLRDMASRVLKHI